MKRVTKEHYTILGVSKNATLDEIKRAYRKRAFELHPDLNPDDVHASRQFQLLNEAYVTLIALRNEEAQAQQKVSDAYKAKTAKAEAQAKAQAETKAENKAKTSSSTSSQSASTSQKQEQPKPEAHRRTYSKPHFEHQNPNEPSEEEVRKKASSAYANEAKKAQSRVFDSFSSRPKNENQAADIPQPSQEDVLRDILNDPFARRVYEDIYSEIKSQGRRRDLIEEEPEPPKPRKVQVEWGNAKIDLDLTNGITGYVKAWLRKQIDDALEYRFPIASLFPGSRIRLQISQGFSKEKRIVDLTLPIDFSIGKPVRLKGMGKKLGKWQGDLYLTLLPLLPKQ